MWSNDRICAKSYEGVVPRGQLIIYEGCEEWLLKSIKVKEGVNFINFYNKVSLHAFKLNYFKEGLLTQSTSKT